MTGGPDNNSTAQRREGKGASSHHAPMDPCRLLPAAAAALPSPCRCPPPPPSPSSIQKRQTTATTTRKGGRIYKILQHTFITSCVSSRRPRPISPLAARTAPVLLHTSSSQHWFDG